MMRFAKIFPDTDRRYRSIVDYNFDVRIDPTDAMACKELSDDYAIRHKLVASNKGIWPDFLSLPMSWPVCSKKFCEPFSAKLDSGQLQIISAPLYSINGKLLRDNYCLVNPLIAVDCLDMQRSKILREPETDYSHEYIRRVDNLTLRADKIPSSITCFRIECIFSALFVREDIIQDLNHACCIGYYYKWVTLSDGMKLLGQAYSVRYGV
jgi:hypothetical protein